MDLLTFILSAALAYAVPIIYAGIGGQISLTAGDLNISLEGEMLGGAFVAVTATYFLGSPWLGIAGAMCAGAMMGLLFGILIVPLKGNVFLVGITFNFLLASLTVLLLGVIFGVRGSFSSPDLIRIPIMPIGPLAGIPVLGPVLSSQTYLAWLVIPLIVLWAYVLRSTALGLRLRALGDNPDAVRSAGLDVNRLRLGVQVVCGMLCGLAGAQLALGALTLFSAGMSAGRGFVALAIVLLVWQRPWLLALVAVLFGATDGIGIKLQQFNMPAQFPQMLPYVVTLLALILVSFRRRIQAGRPDSP
jgi:general nucleoside transport system permease protein